MMKISKPAMVLGGISLGLAAVDSTLTWVSCGMSGFKEANASLAVLIDMYGRWVVPIYLMLLTLAMWGVWVALIRNHDQTRRWGGLTMWWSP